MRCVGRIEKDRSCVLWKLKRLSNKVSNEVCTEFKQQLTKY